MRGRRIQIRPSRGLIRKAERIGDAIERRDRWHLIDRTDHLITRGRHAYHKAIPVPTSHLKRVHVVAHTHWDREWYKTFAGYRSTLIELLDGLMDVLDANPEYRSFMFDGQVAPIDDYLATLPDEVRAQTGARLRRLIADGRIQIGPWYTLSDQFLVSGETTLRNLEYGMARARELGRLMDIAYCPDQFGLIPELPKILRHVGIARAVGERGMKREMPRRFAWRASDGSIVDVLNIKDGYFHRDQSSGEMRRIARRYKGEPALFLAGFDHSVPTSDVAEEATKAGVRMSSLPEYWADLGEPAEPFVHVGEIRAAGDKNILPNVISNRVDQRVEVARGERALERYAEPLAAFCYDVYPSKLLGDMWVNQYWNATHDSACASNIDETTRQVRVRARETFDTAEGITEHSLKRLAARMSEAGNYAWNPSNFERDLWIRDENAGTLRVARQVPPLGWSRLESAVGATEGGLRDDSPIRFLYERDLGDTYTFDPGGPPQAVQLPLSRERRGEEPFTRVRVRWENTEHNHRTRLLIKLPEQADTSTTDTSFGHITRPAVPELVQGHDRLNGFPASKFIVAGGLAVLVDRVAEYELLPETNELAITLVRAHGALSVDNPRFRRGGAGPRLPTHDTQMHQEIDWELAVMPWKATDVLPWREWEEFMLPGRELSSSGGGVLPSRGTYFRNLPAGVFSAVLPDKVRTFEEGEQHRILTAPLQLETSGRPDLGLTA